ncbi:cytochrome P450 [Rhodococcus sp. B50]|uniref:cytochrome P450 n=1 Tax=Rhodococcus sp. B50 TaxID=2682847 RepID=UPI001BD5F520|nr:cytochrome P450 [Rhodococcus sp. B50]MBS9376288.1 Cytochrome p450 CYP199A2 [Rhodococcus sp. B50]
MTSDISATDQAAVDYDPFAPEAMVDPRPIYEKLRAAGPLHYLPQYDAWALCSFEAVWRVTRDLKNFTTEHRGSPPMNSLLGEPSFPNFTQTDPREHAAARRLLQPAYNKAAADHDAAYMRTLAREVITPLVEGGDGTMDVFRDYASRVAARFAGHKAGLPAADSERIRHRAEQLFVREYGQRGTSPSNAEAGAEVFEYLQELVVEARRDPSSARGDLASLLNGTVRGRSLTDQEILGNLLTLIITGSETTEISVAATLYYLARNPEQLAAVRADRSLLLNAFMETVRFDHPTDILCREVVNEVEVCGRKLLPGQQLILMWGSAGRDESEFPDADTYDIHRTYQRHLLFGHGQHKCLGESIALRLGTIMLEEFFEAIDTYEVDWDGCRRKYAEFVQGFNSVPIRFTTA